MSNANLSWRVFIVSCALAAITASGCKEQPEVDPSTYGETLSNLPVIKDLPRAFPIVEELEDKECRVRREAEDGSEKRLYESQGRDLEYSVLVAERARVQHEKDLEEKAIREQKLREAEEEARAKAEAEKTNEQEETSVTEAPAEEPAPEAPAEEPAVEEPAVEEPAVEEPAVEEPAVEEPAVEEPAAEKPAE